MNQTIYPRRAAIWITVIASIIALVAWWQIELGTIGSGAAQLNSAGTVQNIPKATSSGAVLASTSKPKAVTIDESALRPLDAEYLTDGINIYRRDWSDHLHYQLVLADEFDAPSFQVLGSCWESGNAVHESYVKDKNHVYCDTELIKGADPTTFSMLPGSFGDNETTAGIAGLARDKNTIYIATSAFKNVDVESFRNIGVDYAEDADHAYYFDEDHGKLQIILGADLSTFEASVFSSHPLNFDYASYARDKNHTYKKGVITIKPIPPEIFGGG